MPATLMLDRAYRQMHCQKAGWIDCQFLSNRQQTVGAQQEGGKLPGFFLTESKDLRNLLSNALGLRDHLARYDQLYLHLTVTGLGGTAIEPGAPRFREVLAQVAGLTDLPGDPRRVSVRFDPVLFWEQNETRRSNLPVFSEVAEASAAHGIRDIRLSFAQWYGKARRRAAARRYPYVDPPDEEKMAHAAGLAAIAAANGIVLHACSQPLLAGVPGIRPSSCIDGALLDPRSAVPINRDGIEPLLRCSTSNG